MKSTAYGWLMLLGIVVSMLFWTRLARRDHRLMLIYIAALVSAFFGAKLVYMGAEGWLHWGADDFWTRIASGKSVLGALLGGYLGVEIAKRFVGYPNATGDWFALIVPVGIMLGRVGCTLQGCCLGRVCEPSWFTMNDSAGAARWPAAPVELLFNALALGGILLLRHRRKGPPPPASVRAPALALAPESSGSPETRPTDPHDAGPCCPLYGESDKPAPGALTPPGYTLPGQHFHLYLVAYGLFRFAHEFRRATPPIAGGFSGYQFAALGVAGLGLAGFLLRQRAARPGSQSRNA